MAKNTGRGSRVGIFNGRFFFAKSFGGTFKGVSSSWWFYLVNRRGIKRYNALLKPTSMKSYRAMIDRANKRKGINNANR